MASERTWKDPFLYLSLLINIAVHRLWFFSAAPLGYGDAPSFYPPEMIRQITSFQVWSVTGLGGIENMPSSYPYRFLAGLLAQAGASSAVIQRIVFFCPLVVVGSLGSYLLVRKISGSRLGGLAGSVVFNFNTYFIASTSNHIFIASAIAWFPLVLFLYFRLEEQPEIGRSLLCSLPLVMVGAYDFRVFYVCCFVLFLFYLCSVRAGREKKGWVGYTAVFFIPIAITILFNAYWLVPYYLGGAGQGLQGVVVGRPLFSGGLAGTELLYNSVVTFHPVWSWGKLNTFSINSTPFHFVFVPLLAFSALMFERLRWNRWVLFFSFVALVGIFLSKFYSPPLPGAYQWLYDRFPGFNAFREPSKFTFLVYLPYAVLIGCLVGHLQERLHGTGQRKAALCLIVSAVCLLFLVNAVPLAAGFSGTLFVGRDIPRDYEVLRGFLAGQEDYFRTLWVPAYSRWSYYDKGHPKVSCVEALADEWKPLQGVQGAESEGSTVAESVVSFLEKPFAEEVLASASVKYVIVPPEDAGGDDDCFAAYGESRRFYLDRISVLDYLEEVDIGAMELAVFRLHQYRPRIYSAGGIWRLDERGSLEAQYMLARHIEGAESPFTFDDVPGAALGIEDLTAGEARGEGRQEKDMKVGIPPPAEGEGLSLYAERRRGELHCRLSNGTVSLVRLESELLTAGGRILNRAAGGGGVLRACAVEAGDDCWIDADGTWLALGEGHELDLGRVDRIHRLRIYAPTGSNLVPNGSFEQGAWTEGVVDCHAYDERPELGMSLHDGEATDGRYALQLEAARHIAGTFTSFPVEGNKDYALSFDYQSPNGAEAGYYLEFDDARKTVAGERLPCEDTTWRHYRRRLTVPAGASSATLFLYAYEKDGRERMVSRYDRIRFNTLGLVADEEVERLCSGYEKLDFEIGEGDTEISVRGSDDIGENIIPNGSFEQGAWTEGVVDCHAYDERPELGMSLHDGKATDGRYALQLEAARHIAGTFTSFPVEGNKDYALSFDYQSPNGAEAGYYIQFNDERRTAIGERLPCGDKEWRHYQRRITTPLGATAADIAIYSYESDGRERMVVRYDDFRLYRVARDEGPYYLVRSYAGAGVQPAKLEVELRGWTEARVKVKPGGAPVILVMGEKYDRGWELRMEEAAALSHRTSPVSNAAGGRGPSGAGAGTHFRLDGYLNAWYLDVNDVYGGRDLDDGSGEQAEDGLVTLTYAPQVYARTGAVISLLSILLGAALSLLALAMSVKRRWRRGSKKPSRQEEEGSERDGGAVGISAKGQDASSPASSASGTGVETRKSYLMGLWEESRRQAHICMTYLKEHRAICLAIAILFLLLSLFFSLAWAFFVLLALVALLSGLDSRIHIASAMFLLVAFAVTEAFAPSSGLNGLVVWSYLFLVIGICAQIVAWASKERTGSRGIMEATRRYGSR